MPCSACRGHHRSLSSSLETTQRVSVLRCTGTAQHFHDASCLTWTNHEFLLGHKHNFNLSVHRRSLWAMCQPQCALRTYCCASWLKGDLPATSPPKTQVERTTVRFCCARTWRRPPLALAMVSVAACHWAEAEPLGEASSHIACAATPSRARRSANSPRLSRSSSPAPQRATKRTAAEVCSDSAHAACGWPGLDREHTS